MPLNPSASLQSMDVVDIKCISTALMREEGADIIDTCNKVFKRFYFGVRIRLSTIWVRSH